MTFKSQHISVSIECSADKVYAFVSNPANLHLWAAGLSKEPVKNIDGEWIITSPMGKVKIEFADKNAFGVLDHVVTLPTGEKVYNPMRVFPNNDGCEVVFTLYQRSQMSYREFNKDFDAIKKDLEKLKTILNGI